MLVSQVPRCWSTAMDEVAEELIERAEISSPPVDCLVLAERLGIAVAYDATLHGRARHKMLAGRSAILIRPDVRPERLQWAVAHELGEAFAWKVFERAASTAEQDQPELRESVANLMASRLLLPSRWFFDDARRHGWDLRQMKRLYQTASHELIAHRFLDGEEPSMISLFDQGRLVRRSSNFRAVPPRLARVERDCWLEVHRRNQSTECREQSLIVQGWPVHEPGWRRELLRTTFAWDPDDGQLQPEQEPDDFC